MVHRYLLSTLFIASILTVSCRQDDEIDEKTNEDTVFLNKEVSPENESSVTSRDSIYIILNGVDPPKNGTHWKNDSIRPAVNNDYDPKKNIPH
nr:hypothetical protein [uncultured Chryseobacterium sp.]